MGTSSQDGPQRSIDRRSALKKGAAAGAIAWTAPTIISTEVGAVAAFTPKCGATQPVRAWQSSGFSAQCTNTGADLTAQIFLTATNGACGCSNPDYDAEAPDRLGGLPLVSKTSQPDTALGGVEFTFTYKGPGDFVGSFNTGTVFPVAILRCTDRSNRTQEVDRESVFLRIDRTWDCND